MSLQDSSRFFSTKLTDMSGIAKDFTRHFEGAGYAVTSDQSVAGLFLSVTKGGTFQSVVGMKTALNIDVRTSDGGITASMQVGAFGKQILPTALTLFVAWPVLIPQIMGLVSQSKLDEEAYGVIEAAIRKYENNSAAAAGQFCTGCGAALAEGAVFCNKCGQRTNDEIVCASCGTALPPDSAFCTKCGARQ